MLATNVWKEKEKEEEEEEEKDYYNLHGILHLKKTKLKIKIMQNQNDEPLGNTVYMLWDVLFWTYDQFLLLPLDVSVSLIHSRQKLNHTSEKTPELTWAPCVSVFDLLSLRGPIWWGWE